ncbi:hypothetical protein [Phytoactinopolyspora halophila]|uniref:hypothetical protein n=1 Tax=Phytoactinopolyspora halophila TaxID=1981511 RepID=UPI000F4E6ACD|nr:hypothetical protein [Phytoactinopolyspora halophila]
MITLQADFHELREGDNVENPLLGFPNTWGSVHESDGQLLILWPRGVWAMADDFRREAQRAGAPYRIQRVE